MKVLLSPSKSQNYQRNLLHLDIRRPKFWSQSLNLLSYLQRLTPDELGKLMSISPKLQELNFERFSVMQADMSLKNSKPCIQAFTGDVYSGFDLEEYSKQDYLFADKTIRIISGFYGILKPLDSIQPYRLEMKTKLQTASAKNLYEYWSKLVTDFLNQEGDLILNLASKEYSSVIDLKNLRLKLLSADFYELRDDKPKIIAIYAKKARGVMADWIVRNRVEDVENLKSFDLMGYKFNAERSTDKALVFER